MQEYHRPLCEAIIWKELRHSDEVQGAKLKAEGCCRESCGGKLDQAFYPRAPRGHTFEFSQGDTRRVSYCCRNCRRRHTPESERFLSHKIYSHIAVLITLVLYSGRSPAVTLERVRAVSGVSEVSLRRWRVWIEEFLTSNEWKALRMRLSPLFAGARFPASLVEQFQEAGRSVAESVIDSLRFLGVLSRTSYQTTLCRAHSNSTK